LAVGFRSILLSSILLNGCLPRKFFLFFVGWMPALAFPTLGMCQSREDQSFPRDFLAKYCQDCHQGSDAEAKFDVTEYFDDGAIAERLESWDFVLSRIEIADMPPQEASVRPTAEEIGEILRWSKDLRRREANLRRSDPGPNSIRRLTHAEYNAAIEALTSAAIHPADSFPLDPANEAGFDNSAQTLSLPPSLVGKYLDGARMVSSHALLQSQRIAFAPYPVLSETDRDKYFVHKIVDFYRSQPTDLRKYFHALRLLQQELANNVQPDSAIAKHTERIADQIAGNYGLSAKYLRTLAERVLAKESQVAAFGPWREIQKRFNETIASELDERRCELACEKLVEWITQTRNSLTPKREMLKGPKDLHQGTQSLILWYNDQLAADRRTCREDLFDPANKSLLVGDDGQRADADSAALKTTYDDFCSIIPNAFYVSERGRPYAREEKQEAAGRLLSAGFHSMMGYYRDDQPLIDLVLDHNGIEELDGLWREFEYVCELPVRQFTGFLWFERAESRYLWESRFDFARAEDASIVEPEPYSRFATTYLDKLREGEPSPQVQLAVEEYFKLMRKRLDTHFELKSIAQSKHVEDLIRLAEQAYRKPLSAHDRESIAKDYHDFLAISGGDHRIAIDDSIATILTSPWFLFRWDLQPTSAGSDSSVPHPLNPIELASRLSFALWGSIPDQALMQSANRGTLATEEGIDQEFKRMISDPRSKIMLREFMGSWLDFREFTEHKGVDRNEFVSYDDPLQRAMADEPVELLWSILQEGGSLRACLDSHYVIVNSRLASHYGLTALDEHSADPAKWYRVDLDAADPRGGFPTMGVFLTNNSPGLRTSPVKRGYWIIRRLVGERIPSPPPNVPELPKSDRDTQGVSLRELLAAHREHPSCAACHQRFDFAGLLLEGFDPVGRLREEDLAGRKIEDTGTLPDGRSIVGSEALKTYLQTERYEDFRLHFCRSLAAFLLGRTLIVSDDLLIEEMIAKMDSYEQRIDVAIQAVCTSTQFRNKRGLEPAKFTREGLRDE
jgi:hypothetical protein